MELGGQGKTWKINFQNEPYDEQKDLLACFQCQNWDGYKNHQKKQLD